MRLKLLILLLLASIGASAQRTWTTVGANGVQRSTSPDTLYRSNLGASGFAYWRSDWYNSQHFATPGSITDSLGNYYTKSQTDSSFIKNGTTPQSASFNITGNGTIGEIIQDSLNVIKDNFARSSIGGDYTTSLTTASITFPSSAKMQVTGGNNSSANYIQYSTPFQTGAYAYSLEFVPQTNAANDGIGIAFASVIAGNTASIFGYVNLGTANSASFTIYKEAARTTTITNRTGLTFSTTDTLVFSIKRFNSTFDYTLTNKKTGQSIHSSYTYSTVAPASVYIPNLGSPRIYIYGGTQDITRFEITDNTKVNGNAIGIGDSITEGYNGSGQIANYLYQAFNGNTSMFDISAGVGEKSSEISPRIARAVLANPNYVLINIGTNNGSSTTGYQADVESAVTTLQGAGITPILITLTPKTSYSVVPFNDILQTIATTYSVKLIDTYTPLTGGSGTQMATIYNSDGTHPNDAGLALIGSIIRSEAPELYAFANSSLTLNNIGIQDWARYSIGINDANEIVKIPFITPLFTGYGRDAILNEEYYNVKIESPVTTSSNGYYATNDAGTVAAMAISGSVASSNPNSAILGSSKGIVIASNSTVSTGGTDIITLKSGGHSATRKWSFTTSGLGFNGIATPTAQSHYDAGSATAGSAPIKFTSGALNAAPEVGAEEFLTDRRYFTITTGGARKTYAWTDDVPATATALANSRTIWGQSFNGTANVSGALTGVTAITATGNYSATSSSSNSISSTSSGTTTNASVNAINDAGSVLQLVSYGSAAVGNDLGTTRAGNSMVLYAGTGNMAIGSRSTNDIIFSTNNTERARITGAGAFSLASATASTIASFDVSKNIVSLPTATYPNLTELSYVKGVTSGVQAQLNAKGSGTVTSITPGYGFTSSTPITTSGTMTVDTASATGIVAKSRFNTALALKSNLSGGNTFTGNQSVNGTVTANSFIKVGGVSVEFLMADGSSNSTAYATQAFADTKVGLSGNETINGTKTMTGLVANSPTLITPIETKSISTITSNFTITTGNYYTLLADATSGSITATLPTASSASGRIYVIKKIDISVNTVTIDGDGSELIDGATTQVMAVQWSSLTVQSNGTAWYILSKN